MELQTKVALPENSIRLKHESKILLLGSCFAQHIGLRMIESGLEACVNPFGVLYNPESIARALECIMENECPADMLFEGRDGLWHSWLHSGDFSAPTKAEVQTNIATRLSEAQIMHDADVLCITWGTAHIYKLKDGGFVVGNCHKERASDFETSRLTVEEIVARWKPLLAEIGQKNPKLQVVFTISPYRYAGYGLHESQLSKATLHLAADALCKEFAQCHYFPAYEIVIDELRDYRFYDADMLHPSAVAIGYVWERFADWCFTKETKEYIRDYQAIMRDRQHRPLHPESEEHKKFRKKAEEREQEFELKWRGGHP